MVCVMYTVNLVADGIFVSNDETQSVNDLRFFRFLFVVGPPLLLGVTQNAFISAHRCENGLDFFNRNFAEPQIYFSLFSHFRFGVDVLLRASYSCRLSNCTNCKMFTLSMTDAIVTDLAV